MSEILKIFHPLSQHPFIALFLTISLGYVVGKIKYKTFVLGGISGSLLMGVIIGQFGINVPHVIGTVFFALFLYAVGYQGGASFFKSLNRRTAVELVSATITCVLGLLCVLGFAWFFHLDRGTAAGLAAGGLTQSAMIGSATAALGQLHATPAAIHLMQTNVAVGYAVCYIFGSFGPIILLATFFPLLMKWNLRKEAIKLATEQDQGHVTNLGPGQFSALTPVSTRVYEVGAKSDLVGKTANTVLSNQGVAVESVLRQGEVIEVMPELNIEAGDVIVLTAKTDKLVGLEAKIGHEVPKPAELDLVEETRAYVLSNHQLQGKTLAEMMEVLHQKQCYGLFPQKVIRFGDQLPLTVNLKLKRGDDIQLVGKSQDLDQATAVLGKKITAAPVTDFVFFGLGMVFGFLLGMISFKIFGVSITLGSGVGCLVAGLTLGWFQSVRPQYASLPAGASNFLRDFGLAVFVAVIGLTAGPEAVTAIKTHGLELFFMGIGVTLIPQILTFVISYYILRIKNPIHLLATIAGGRSANPGFAALLDKAGNATPVIPFTATYALANIWLTLWGPLIVALVPWNAIS